MVIHRSFWIACAIANEKLGSPYSRYPRAASREGRVKDRAVDEVVLDVLWVYTYNGQVSTSDRTNLCADLGACPRRCDRGRCSGGISSLLTSILDR